MKSANEYFIDKLTANFEKLGFFAKIEPLPDKTFGVLGLKIDIKKGEFGYNCEYGVSTTHTWNEPEEIAGQVAWAITKAFEHQKDLKDAHSAYFTMRPFGRAVFTTMCLERHIDLRIGEYNENNAEVANYLVAQGLAFALPQLYPQEITLTPTNKAMYFYDTLKEKKLK